MMEIPVSSQPRPLKLLMRKFLYGGKEATEAVARAAMKDVDAARTREFKDRTARHRASSKYTELMNRALMSQLRKEQNVPQAFKEFRKLAKRNRGSTVKPSAPKVPREEPRLFTGSVGDVITPPCMISREAEAVSGQPYKDIHTNPANGTMGFFLDSNLDDYSIVNVWLALGAFLYPPTNGRLVVQSNLSFVWDWQTTISNGLEHLSLTTCGTKTMADLPKREKAR
jgi:hypothetical protein